MADFNLKYYKGEDLYSDGEIENEILRIVESDEDMNSVLSNEQKFPVVYHLSHLRENILNWYPFKEDDTVLEIGAGCGAITGLLCRKCGKVVSAELSKRRSYINFKRHEQYENLEIFVGNLNDMEFSNQFDYIILNGVFEYAISFTESENPYIDFLSDIIKHLKEDGKILIAIENRLGLKYFAGSSEDHTNLHYLGLNNYQGVDSVKTFSKYEMNEILHTVGLTEINYYYPYPDYKFPNEIFTDKTINKMSYGRNSKHFERDRVSLFNMETVFDSLKNEEIVDVFANSFLVEASLTKKLSQKEIIYAKISDDRDERFQIVTRIIENSDGNRSVEKYALTQAANEHIEKMKRNSILETEKYYNLSNISNDLSKLEYEYIRENNLNDYMYKSLKKGDVNSFKDELQKVYISFFSGAQESDDFYTQDFIQVFGNQRGNRSYRCICPANIDLVLDNIYILQNKYCVIDCEWVFDFFVPSEFIMWRAINELYNKYPELYNILDRRIVHDWFGISKEDESVFLTWSLHFSQVYVGCDSLASSYQQTIEMPFEQIVDEYRNKKYIISVLYLNNGSGYSESNIIRNEYRLVNNSFTLEFDVSDNPNLISARWDPAENPCSCKNIKVFLDDVAYTAFTTNADSVYDNVFVFNNMDPSFEFNLNKAGVKKIRIEGEIEYIPFEKSIMDLNACITRKEKELESIQNEKDEQISYYQNTLADIQNTVLWRSTEWIRKISSLRQKKKYKALYAIEQCDYLNGSLSIQGWIIPKEKIDLEMIYQKGKYQKKINVLQNIKREDVAKTFKDEALTNCGFVGEWNIRNLKKGNVYLQYSCNGYHFKEKVGRCGIGFIDEIRFYLGEIRKNGIKPYLFYLKPANFLKFLQLRKLPIEAGEDLLQNVYPDLIDFIDRNITDCSADYISNDNIYVVIPVYNGYQYLDKLFKDIYKTNINFQLIIINDRSTDSRVDVFLKDFQQIHPEAIVIENEENMGFLPSVNKALHLAEGHVALVNTDVELPNGWLERLMSPILKDKTVASTTPFTNSGTICSFPDFCCDNKLFGGMSVDEIDSTFVRFKEISYEIPTGIGFCMGMNKLALDKVGILDEENFGKGYGEENDWCQRAIKAGFKNVHVCNLFVYHNHGGSFPSEEKKRLLEEHRINLLKKHPQYEIDVAQYCSKDPAKALRQYALFDLIMKSNKKRTLYFNHMLGGGATEYLLKKKEEKCNNGEIVVIVTYNYVNNVYNLSVNFDKYNINYSIVKIADLQNILQQYVMSEVIINELVTYPNLYLLLEWLVDYTKTTSAKLIMLMHDYFSVCPTINLLDQNRNYCKLKDCESCNLEQCSVAYVKYGNMDLWKRNWRRFLENCAEVIVFSRDSENIINRQYGKLDNIVYTPHVVNYMPELNKNIKLSDTINIGILGVLSEHKGGRIVQEMLQLIEKQQLNINIILIGYTDGAISINSDHFIETGRYSVGELPKKIYRYDIDLFFIPSIWPETFSYTTQEIIEMNMPIAVFDIGAPAERVKEYDKGVIIPEINAQQALEMLVEYSDTHRTKEVHYPKVLFIAEYLSFSSRYRVEHLMEQLNYRGIQSVFSEIGDVDIHSVSEFDKLVVYRCRISEKMKQLIAVFRSAGKKVLYDIDDYIFEYDKIKDLEFMNDSEYKDFDKYCQKVHECMDLADGFITSTVNMKNAIERVFPDKSVFVNRNVASAEMLIESLKVINKVKNHNRIVLGYFSGSKTHDGDFALISDVLLKILREHDNIYLKIGGCLQLNKQFDEFSDRILKFDFVDWRKLPALIQSVDINLMPLEDSFFHACKSENKWMEAALVKVPTIASYNSELELEIRDGENGFLCRNIQEWYEKLEKLISDASVRSGIAENAFAYCREHKITINAELGGGNVWFE